MKKDMEKPLLNGQKRLFRKKKRNSWVTVCMPVCAALMLISAIGRYVKLMKETDQKQIAKL